MQVLVIDDDEVDSLCVKQLFYRAFPQDKVNVECISSPAALNTTIEIEEYDICIIDQNIGQYSGIEIIRNLNQKNCLTPMILLTGQDDKTIDKKASEYGASDYLLKGDLTAELLNRSVRFSISQKEHENKLALLAYKDGLTGLANRTKFDQTLEMALHTTKRAGDFLALFLVDLDDFKKINDTFGHPAGDGLLIEIANRLTSVVRRSDLVARIGGDEFGIILNGYKNKGDVILLKDKIKAIFDEPVQFEQRTFHCKASIGIATVSPSQNERETSILLRAADNALYRAKQVGKNSCEFFDPAFGEAIAKIAKMEHALSLSLQNEELEIYFQPKISVGTQMVCGAEALLRWSSKELGMVGPAIFIPLAERSLFIQEIGRWTIEETCRKLRAWIDSGIDVVPIAINISPLQMQRDSFVTHITDTLADYQIDPTLVEFEITETALMENLQTLKECMVSLAEIGCKWVIDDFGVGYSSLTRIKDLPISKIKLDRHFVMQVETSETSRKICNIVTLLANELDLVLVVEGVERQSQIDMLPLFDKDELQGFFYSKPIPAFDYIRYLEGPTPNVALLPEHPGPSMSAV